VIKELWHKLGSPRYFYEMSRHWAVALGIAAILLLGLGTVWGLAFAPADYQQGNSFRVMYLHVPTAFAAQSAYILMGAASLVLLVWRMKLADIVATSVAPIGLSLTAIALFTGAIWGKPTWGTWWIWDGRTTSMLVLLFLYFGVIALRDAISNQESAGRACAILSIVGLINIPIIKYSVVWWLTLHQGESLSLTEAPSMPASMYLPLIINILGIYCFMGSVIISAVRTLILKREQHTQWVRDTLLGTPGTGKAG